MLNLEVDQQATSHADELLRQYHSHPSAAGIAALLEAIQIYESTLLVYTEADSPADWALTQTKLGIAYSDLPRGNRGANLERAIACYQAALRVYTERDFPADWATAQHNLGAPYADLPRVGYHMPTERRPLRLYTHYCAWALATCPGGSEWQPFKMINPRIPASSRFCDGRKARHQYFRR